MKKSGAEILWECVTREGVEVVFGYPGGANMPIYDAMLSYPVHHVLVRHHAPHTASRMRHRAVVSDRATSVFDGQAHVLAHAVGCEAHQHSKNLLLSDRGAVHTKPHLEIYVDEVVASHGATVGALDPDALFYLETRGIPETDARTLLTYAFLQELVDAIGHPALRVAMRDLLLSRLPNGELVRALDELSPERIDEALEAGEGEDA